MDKIQRGVPLSLTKMPGSPKSSVPIYLLCSEESPRFTADLTSMRNSPCDDSLLCHDQLSSPVRAEEAAPANKTQNCNAVIMRSDRDSPLPISQATQASLMVSLGEANLPQNRNNGAIEPNNPTMTSKDARNEQKPKQSSHSPVQNRSLEATGKSPVMEAIQLSNMSEGDKHMVEKHATSTDKISPTGSVTSRSNSSQFLHTSHNSPVDKLDNATKKLASSVSGIDRHHLGRQFVRSSSIMVNKSGEEITRLRSAPSKGFINQKDKALVEARTSAHVNVYNSLPEKSMSKPKTKKHRNDHKSKQSQTARISRSDEIMPERFGMCTRASNTTEPMNSSKSVKLNFVTAAESSLDSVSFCLTEQPTAYLNTNITNLQSESEQHTLTPQTSVAASLHISDRLQDYSYDPYVDTLMSCIPPTFVIYSPQVAEEIDLQAENSSPWKSATPVPPSPKAKQKNSYRSPKPQPMSPSPQEPEIKASHFTQSEKLEQYTSSAIILPGTISPCIKPSSSTMSAPSTQPAPIGDQRNSQSQSQHGSYSLSSVDKSESPSFKDITSILDEMYCSRSISSNKRFISMVWSSACASCTACAIYSRHLLADQAKHHLNQ